MFNSTYNLYYMTFGTSLSCVCHILVPNRLSEVQKGIVLLQHGDDFVQTDA